MLGVVGQQYMLRPFERGFRKVREGGSIEVLFQNK